MHLSIFIFLALRRIYPINITTQLPPSLSTHLIMPRSTDWLLVGLSILDWNFQLQQKAVIKTSILGHSVDMSACTIKYQIFIYLCIIFYYNFHASLKHFSFYLILYLFDVMWAVSLAQYLSVKSCWCDVHWLYNKDLVNIYRKRRERQRETQKAIL